MANDVIAQIPCLMCGNPHATIHKQKGRREAFYIRCYESVGSMNAVCGTLQCTGPKGQELIRAALAKGGITEQPQEPKPPKGQMPAQEPAKSPKGEKQESAAMTFSQRFWAGDE